MYCIVFRNHLPLTVALAGIACVGGCVVAVLPFDTLLANFLPDDAFYYFKVAEHVLAGHGSTFDGIHFTNGYHPLWLILLLPVFALFGTAPSLAPLFAVLALGVILFAATTVVLYAIVARYTERSGVRALALFAWVANPFLWYEYLNGLETGLMLFLLALFMYAATHARQNRGLIFWVFLGALGGLLTLARLDAIFYPAVFFAFAFFRAPREQFRNICIAGIAFLATLAPWFLWNYAASGMFFTSASVTSTFVNHHLTIADNGPGLFTFLKATASFTIHGALFALTQTGAWPLVLGVCIFGAWRFLRNHQLHISAWRTLPAELVIFGGFALMFIANASVRWSMRNWYFIAFDFFAVIAFAAAIAYLGPHCKKPRLASFAFVALFLASAAFGWAHGLKDREAPALEMKAAADWNSAHLPRESIIGTFNSGVQAYFTRQRVVNLDGLINQSASEAMRRGELWRYIKDARIDYISDFDIYLSYRYRDFFGIPDPFAHLTEIHRIKLQDHNRSASGIAIYRVEER